MVNELKFYSRPTVSLHDKIPNDKDDENLSIEYTQKDENTPTPTQIAELESLKQCLADVLKELTPQEADIIKKRFGLNNQNTLTLEQIAKTYNVKAERIRQIEAKTLRKISHSSKFSHLKDFLEVSDY
jgi:RNA polymerase primary sigma factor